jgi:hypothetical protein
MKLLKITQFGFYTSIQDRKYVAIELDCIEKYLNAFLSQEFGNKDYSEVIESFIKNDYYFKDKIDNGLGDIMFEIIGEIEVIKRSKI